MSFLGAIPVVNGLLKTAGGRAVPSFVNHKKDQIAGKVIGGIGRSVESKVDARVNQEIDKFVPKFAQAKVKGFADRQVHSLVQKGEGLARKEVSKIRL